MHTDSPHYDRERKHAHLPDVTGRWIGKVTDLNGEHFTVSVRPRGNDTATPVTRTLRAADYRSRRTPRVGDHVFVDEFSDGVVVVGRIGRWYSAPVDWFVEAALWLGLGVAAAFN